MKSALAYRKYKCFLIRETLGKLRTGEIAYSIKCLLLKHEDLSSNLQHTFKKENGTVKRKAYTTPALGVWEKETGRSLAIIS